MSVIVLFVMWIWVGGMTAAYRANRWHGFGVFKSSLEAFVWPVGVGYYLAKNFYINCDWNRGGDA